MIPFITAKNTLENITENIKRNANVYVTNIQLRAVNHNSGVHTLKNNKYSVIINISRLYDHIDRNNNVDDKDFVDTIISCYHEERHLQQAFFYQQDSCTPEIRNMAHTDILRAAIPEYYRLDTGYYTNINEIDAELYGIRKTRAFLQTYFPEINSEKVMTELIQSYPHWYANNNITSVNEAIYNLEKAKEQAYNKPVLLPIRYTKNQKYSPNLQAFISNESRRQAYIQAYDNHDGKTANQLILNFIKEELPWRFRAYPCLQDEWTDAVRTAKPTLIDKLTGHQRESITQEEFDHRMQQLQAVFPDLSDNTPENPNDFSL